MKKVIKLVLMLCLVLSGALCYAHGVARTENWKGGDGTPIEIIKNANHCGSEKGSSIQASINGHCLLIAFTENLGQVAVEITTAMGVPMENLWIYTPNGIQTYLSLCGDYIVNFTLHNGMSIMVSLR